jgi:type IV fimbrial biogenesis protein FimT
MKPAGLTLVELLVTLVIVAIMLRLAAPAFRDLTAASRSSAALNHLIGAVALARSSAVTHYDTVTLCPGAERACLGRDQWHRGALVFLDRDGDGRLDGEDAVLRRLPSLDAGGRIYWRSFRNRSYLQFLPKGYTPWQNGHFLYCAASGNPKEARMLILNVQGRLRPARDSNGDGVVEDASGKPVSCPT